MDLTDTKSSKIKGTKVFKCKEFTRKVYQRISYRSSEINNRRLSIVTRGGPAVKTIQSTLPLRFPKKERLPENEVARKFLVVVLKEAR